MKADKNKNHVSYACGTGDKPLLYKTIGLTFAETCARPGMIAAGHLVDKSGKTFMNVDNYFFQPEMFPVKGQRPLQVGYVEHHVGKGDGQPGPASGCGAGQQRR